MLRAGWRLVWRRQRLVLWIYILSLGLSFFAAQPLVRAISPILNNSLVADRLYHNFDLGTLGELLARPEVDSQVLTGAPILAGVVFLVLMVLLTGGILKVYHEDRTFTTGEFFGAGGLFFWRFVRLVIFLLIVLIPVALINWGFRAWTDNLEARYASPAPNLVVKVAGKLLILFLLIAVRLWFDMAEVGAVAEDEYTMRRSLSRAFRLTWNNFRRLFWLYLQPILAAGMGTAVVVWVWVREVRHQAITTSFLLSQFVILLWIFARLWQRSTEVLWHQQFAPVADILPEVPQPDLESSMEPPPAPEAPPAEVSL